MRQLLALTTALVLAGCVGELTDTGPNNNTTPDAMNNGAGARAFYDLNINNMFNTNRPKGTCASCHEGNNAANGPDFLGADITQHYSSLVANTRLVGTTPEASLLITRGDHTGDAFCIGVGVPYAACAQDEIALLRQWIQMEAAN